MGLWSDGNALGVVWIGQEVRSKRVDRWCLFIFPILFALVCSRVVLGAAQQL